jgi:hypothetical protein
MNEILVAPLCAVMMSLPLLINVQESEMIALRNHELLSL